MCGPKIRVVSQCCPHARGGVPRSTRSSGSLRSLSPRTWGCTGRTADANWTRDVVPTHVGVYSFECGRRGFPSVVPTHVGVYRSDRRAAKNPCSCPHARGGVPVPHPAGRARAELSPRTWGCTVNEILTRVAEIVVPTHVGVYRHGYRYWEQSLCNVEVERESNLYTRLESGRRSARSQGRGDQADRRSWPWSPRRPHAGSGLIHAAR